MEVVASLSQSHTAAAQCGLFTHKSVPVIFEPPCNYQLQFTLHGTYYNKNYNLLALLIFQMLLYDMYLCHYKIH